MNSSNSIFFAENLFIVVEFCPYGNLHEYLKARRGLFVNFVKNGEIRSDFGNMGYFDMDEFFRCFFFIGTVPIVS